MSSADSGLGNEIISVTHNMFCYILPSTLLSPMQLKQCEEETTLRSHFKKKLHQCTDTKKFDRLLHIKQKKKPSEHFSILTLLL
jgi:predicted nucleotidyltransferase